MAYLVGVAFAVLLYVSVLLHEISHAVAARAFQMPVTSINLHFLGGATEIEGEASTPWREFVIAVVGPLTSLAIGGIAYLAIDSSGDGLAPVYGGGARLRQPGRRRAQPRARVCRSTGAECCRPRSGASRGAADSA